MGRRKIQPDPDFVAATKAAERDTAADRHHQYGGVQDVINIEAAEDIVGALAAEAAGIRRQHAKAVFRWQHRRTDELVFRVKITTDDIDVDTLVYIQPTKLAGDDHDGIIESVRKSVREGLKDCGLG